MEAVTGACLFRGSFVGAMRPLSRRKRFPTRTSFGLLPMALAVTASAEDRPNHRSANHLFPIPASPEKFI